MNRDLLEYAKWYLTEDEYLISNSGNLLVRYPDYKGTNSVPTEVVIGFRFYIYISYETNVKPYDTGKPTVIVPRDIAPINDWELK